MVTKVLLLIFYEKKAGHDLKLPLWDMSATGNDPLYLQAAKNKQDY